MLISSVIHYVVLLFYDVAIMFCKLCQIFWNKKNDHKFMEK